MRSRGMLMGVAVAAVVAGTFALGGWQLYAREEAASANAAFRKNFVPQVRVATVAPTGNELLVRLPATTSAFAAANILARASGYVATRSVDIGDRVKAGDQLATIVAPELDHQISQAEATLSQLEAAAKQARANQKLASVTWRRDEPLVKEGWIPKQQGTVDVQTLRATDAAVSVAEANVVAQQAQLQVLKQQKAYQSVVAPFDGVVTQRNIDVGSLVQADATTGTFMFTVMQTDVIRTFVYVPQDQAVGVAPGVDAAVHIPELPGRSFPGKVTRIADALQPDTRTLRTEIDVPNPDGTLQPGSYCTAELHIPRKEPLLVVPADAIVFDADGLHVAVLEDGVARFRKVIIARDLGTQVELSDGVKAGDTVIRSPAVNLAEGSRVQATPVKAAAN